MIPRLKKEQDQHTRPLLSLLGTRAPHPDFTVRIPVSGCLLTQERPAGVQVLLAAGPQCPVALWGTGGCRLLGGSLGDISYTLHSTRDPVSPPATHVLGASTGTLESE